MVQWRALVLLVLLALLAQGRASPLPSAPASAPAPKDEEDNNMYRLPSDKRIEPSHYEIVLKPDYNREEGANPLNGIETFHGKVVITADVVIQVPESEEVSDIESINEIYLNCDDNIQIEADAVKVFYLGSTTTTPASVTSTPADGGGNEPEEDAIVRTDDDGWGLYTGVTLRKLPKDILVITVGNPIYAGTTIKIEIEYTQTLDTEKQNGFYVSTYTDKENSPKTVLATQFESTYARKAFPCFDEPEFKAEFDLSIEVIEGVKAIANTESESTDGNTIKFKKTPKMSTYLLAFVVYEEASFGTLQTTGTFKTYARSEALADNLGTISQSDGPKMIEDLVEYTDVQYYKSKGGSYNMGMNKMDQVAIPDFASGAMENWGLVTYRESALLVNGEGSQAAQKRVSQVIAHELAHQWFGNWVTTKWWNTIWLNEGFADLFEYKVMHKRYNQWKMEERMVLDEQMYAFDADSELSSPELSLPEDSVKTPDQISKHFGTITYSKGGSILRQIENVLGDGFQAAVQEYLQAKQFDSATPEDLFEKFENNNDEEVSGLPEGELLKVLENWTKKPGYPVVTVKKNGNNMELTQTRFLFSTNDETSTRDDTKYDVYLTWITDNDIAETKSVPPQSWFRSTDGETKQITDMPEQWSWVLLNVHQGGYYRVDYSKELWDALKTALSDHTVMEKIAALDRAGLINNALSLVRGDDRNMNYDDVFTFLLFLKHDDAFESWAALRYSLGHVIRMMGNTLVYRNFIRNVVQEAYGKLDPNKVPSDHVQITHYVNVMTVACGGNYASCLNWAEEKLTAALRDSDPQEVNVNLQSIAYCYGLKNAPSLWDPLWEKYLAARKDMTRRQLIASALGCVKDDGKLETYLKNSINSTIDIPNSERYLAFSAVYTNLDNGPAVAIKFLRDTTVDVVASAYGGVERMTSLLNGLAGYLTTDAQRQSLSAAIGTNAAYQDCLKIVDNNVKWRNKNEDAITRGLTRASDASAMSLATGLVLLCAAVLRYFR